MLGGISDDISGWRNALLGNLTNDIVQWRNAVLNDSTSLLLAGIGGHFTDTVAATLRNKLLLPLDSSAKDAGKVASGVAWGLAGAVALLMILGAYLVVTKHRYENITDVLTSKIHDMPDVVARDQFLANISQTARDRGVEIHLRKFLDERGILGDKSRKWVAGNGPGITGGQNDLVATGPGPNPHMTIERETAKQE